MTSTAETVVETWRPIPDYPNYEAGDQGHIRSFHPWRGLPVPHILNPSPASNGYYMVPIRRADGRKTQVTVHKLVMAAFVGPRPDGMEVRHLNGSPRDNRLTNLAYGTPSENEFDKVRHGTHHLSIRTHCKNGHEFDESNTKILTRSNGRASRVCLACARDRNRKYEARLRLDRADDGEVVGL